MNGINLSSHHDRSRDSGHAETVRLPRHDMPAAPRQGPGAMCEQRPDLHRNDYTPQKLLHLVGFRASRERRGAT